MFHYQKQNTKNLISQGLYQLMLEKSFDKITIKQICDKAQINRGTFYNHFIDKYKALEYLTHLLLIDEQVDNLGNKDYNDLIKIINSINQVFYDHQVFFNKAFQIQGQNGFEEILTGLFDELFSTIYDNKKVGITNQIISKEFFISYQSATYLFIIKQWIRTDYKMSLNELLKICLYLADHSFKDIIEGKEE